MVQHKVYVCGDTHGDYDIKKLSTSNWKEQKNLTKDDMLIVLGDFGLPWSCQIKESNTTITSYADVVMSKNDTYWLEWLASKNFTTLVVLGNHEGIYNILKYIPKTYYEPIKGYVRELKMKSGSILFLSRDEVYTINGKTFLVIGGAMSVDKTSRLPGVTWWADEDLTHEETENILNTLEQVQYFDYVLSHTCPSYMIEHFVLNVFKLQDPTAKFLAYVENIIEFGEWHFGHFHVDELYVDRLGSYFYCHYNNKPHQLM